MTAEGVAQSLLDMHGAGVEADFRRAALWRWLVARIPPGLRVLDAGCGTGYMARELGRRGNPTVALEPDPALAASAEALIASEALEVLVVKAALGDGTLVRLGHFDRILCLDVIEHVQDEVPILEELRAALAPRGRLLVSVPALPFLFGARDRALGHFRRYTPSSLRKALSAAGLRVHELRFWNATGVLPYLLSEQVLRRPLPDGLRRPGRSSFKRLAQRALRGILELEARTWVPVGLSLLASCSVKRSR
jgi:SAM-dependent methyltransferase